MFDKEYSGEEMNTHGLSARFLHSIIRSVAVC